MPHYPTQSEALDAVLHWLGQAVLAYSVCGAVAGLLLGLAGRVVHRALGEDAAVPARVATALACFGIGGCITDIALLVRAAIEGDLSSGTAWRFAAWAAICASCLVVAVLYAPLPAESPESAAASAKIVERRGPRPKVMTRCSECGRNEWPACRCQLAREGYPMTSEDPDEISRGPVDPVPVWGTPPAPRQEK